MTIRLFGTGEEGIAPREAEFDDGSRPTEAQAREVMERLQWYPGLGVVDSQPAPPEPAVVGYVGDLADELLDSETTFDEANEIIDKFVPKPKPVKKPARKRPAKRAAAPKVRLEISTEATVVEAGPSWMNDEVID